MRFVLFLFLAVGGAGLDLWTKHQVFRWKGLPGEQEPYWIVEPFVGIETAVNMGALFGLGQGMGWLFSSLSIVAAIGIIYWLFVLQASRSLWLTVAMGLVMGGIFGNLYDRLAIPDLPSPWAGGVRDWILFRYGDYVWPNFNIADSVLVIGAVMLAVYSFRQELPAANVDAVSRTEPDGEVQSS
ncbi:signal peptidase II [Pirellulaceae bacterium SH467]|jgi:signal peptidase II